MSSSSATLAPTVIFFDQLRMTDLARVGGKNSSLGEMLTQLTQVGVRVPEGFATTAEAFREFLATPSGQDSLRARILQRIAHVDVEDVQALALAGNEVRAWIRQTPLPEQLVSEIRQAYAQMTQKGQDMSFAVRSSATAEDLPEASFAGQQETFLNIQGIENILAAVHEVFASLYNDRAIAYRAHQKFAESEIAISVGVQRMVRSDIGASGVMFTIDTESGFKEVVFITASYGLGEALVQGAVNPDEFYVHKPLLDQGFPAILSRRLGSKLSQMVFSGEKECGHTVKMLEVLPELRHRYALSDADVLELARIALKIERHYGCPMDIEWGKDGQDGHLYILQARPETVKSHKALVLQRHFKLKDTGKLITAGRAIGQSIGKGCVRIIHDLSQMHRVQAGDVLVADMTDPNWEPVMKRASAIVTNRGGRTCHAAIIVRELGVPAVVGCGNATELLQDGQKVTVSCAEGDEGRIYDGLLETEITETTQADTLPALPVDIMLNVGNPQRAFDFQALPNCGVGLARLEFIINNVIGIHPRAVLDYPRIDVTLRQAIDRLSQGYATPRAFYVAKLTEGIATIAGAFWPKKVIVRLSDFKSNEYKKLLGGTYYEPDEENPMLGFRGAVRYLDSEYADAFAMECEALQTVRNTLGLTNVEIMLPFVRTVSQAQRVIGLLARHGLRRGENKLRIIMMCEIPANAILAEAFLAYFDGFSIGSNDLTQLILGLDRDSGMPALAADFDERDPAVMALLQQVIKTCRAQNRYVGICGQGPTDHPDFAQWLMQEGISSISLNPDTVVDTWHALGAA